MGWLLFVLLLGCSCSEELPPPPPTPDPPSYPTRVVSLSPGITDILYRLEADPVVVGISNYCNQSPTHPAERVGSLLKPDYETLESLKPERVLLMHQPDVEAELTRRGLAFSVIQIDSFGNLIDAYLQIGELLGLGDKAREWHNRTLAQIQALKDKLGNTERRRVLFVLGPYPRLVGGRKSIYHDMIRFARGTNVAMRPDAKLYMLDPDEVRRERPEVIVVALDQSVGGRRLLHEEKRFWRQFSDVPAVRDDRVVILDEKLFIRPGPQAIDGWQLLARTLHPQHFH